MSESEYIGKALIKMATAKAQPRAFQSMLIDRERPASSGWCGNENCKHRSHKHFNKPAVAVE